jgi:hypothetical protein
MQVITSHQVRSLSVGVGAVLLIALTAVGCDSFLNVEQNPNQPNRQRALANPEDVVSLTSDAFFRYWRAMYLWSPGQGLSNAANEFRGGFAADDLLGQIPRVPWNNSTTFGDSNHNEFPWNRGYSAISSTNDAISTIRDAQEREDTEFLSEIDEQRALAFGKFVQGISHAAIAAIFDRGFIVRSDSLEGGQTPSLRPYPKVMSAAMQMFDESIRISEENSFQLPSSWINGNPMTSAEFARFVRSIKARFMTAVARRPEERQHDPSDNPLTNDQPGLINWNEVARLTENGIQENFQIQLDGLGPENWGNFNQWLMGQSDGWGRMSYYTLGPADNKPAAGSGLSFGEWLATDPAPRSEERPENMIIHTQDRRIVGDVPEEVEGTDQDNNGVEEQWDEPGTDYQYLPGFASSYAGVRLTNGATQPDILTNDDVGPNDGTNLVGPINYVLKAEMDLLRAEALLRTDGSAAQVADLINNTRVNRGKLPEATTANPTGSPDSPIKNGRPQNGYSEVSLWSMVKYEKTIEQYCSATGLSYFDKRGWGDLVEGTPLQFPIPGSELQNLGLENYTFGGSENVGDEDAFAAEGGWNPADYTY